VKAKLNEPALRTSHQNTPETISTIGIDVRKNTFWCNSQWSRHWCRSSAFGTFTASYGKFWFIGRATIGIIYDVRCRRSLLFACSRKLPLCRSCTGWPPEARNVAG
jgi:hypothetical protein